MPIYEYKCESCGRVSDILVKNRVNTSSLTCPHCQSDKMEKLISVPGKMISKGGSECASAPACPSGGCCNAQACPAFQH